VTAVPPPDGVPDLAPDRPGARPTPGRPEPEAVRGMFGAIARRYDLLNTLASLGEDRRWRRRAAQLTRARPGDRALDVCTGTGLLAGLLARRVGPDGEVVGVDFTEAMLERARGRLPAVRWICADARALPIPTAAVDVATMAFGLRNIDDPVLALRELHRVVRPGGRVVVLEFSRIRWGGLARLSRWYNRRVVAQIARRLAPDPTAYAYLAASIEAFPPPLVVSGWFRAAGFAEVEVVRMSLGLVALHVARRAGEPAGRLGGARAAPQPGSGPSGAAT